MQHDAVIIEVGVNENVGRDRHPHVPITAAEIALDAGACQDAGAAIVHWHARDDETGAPLLDDTERYAAAMRGVRPERDLLMYPTYTTTPSDSPDVRFAHVWALREMCGLELAPVDLGSVNLAPWDVTRGRFGAPTEMLGAATVFQNSPGLLIATIERAVSLGMTPAVAAFDVGFTRMMVLLVEAGILPTPVYLKIFLSEGLAAGPFPDERGIEAHLSQIPVGLDVEWCVVPFHVRDPALAGRLGRYALERGGSVRIGVGDNPIAYPDATNADLVTMAAGWAADAGRPVASSADVRRRFAIGDGNG